MRSTAAILTLLASPLVLAQSVDVATGALVYPPSRGSHGLSYDVAPCQGWALGLRVNYPLSGGTVGWTANRDINDIVFRYSTNSDPQAQTDFQDAITNTTGGWTGQQCVNGPNFQALGLSAGQNITLQFAYKTGPGQWDGYECADLTLVTLEAYKAGNWDDQCLNRVQTTQNVNTYYANPALQAKIDKAATDMSNATKTGGGLTPTEAGLTGAFVTLGALLIALVVAAIAGFVAFGKNAKRARRTSHGAGSIETKTISSV